MIATPPTGPAYRTALKRIQGSHPAVAAAITDHVNRLRQLLAGEQVQRAQLTARVRELAALKNEIDLPADVVVVATDGEPIAMTGPQDVALAALALIDELVNADQSEVGGVILAASVIHGPVASVVFSTALQLVVEPLHPVLVAALTASEGDGT